MSMKFERDERKFDFHDIGCEIKRKRETTKIRIRDGSASSNASCQGANPLKPLLLSLYCKLWSENPHLHENTEYSSHFTVKYG